MKKSIIALIIAVMVVVVGGVVFLQLTRAGLPMEDVVPSGALVYVKVSNFGKALKDFKTTKLWRNISAINMATILKESGVPKERIDHLKEAKKKISDLKLDVLAQKFFGRETALALYAWPSAVSVPLLPSDLLANVLIIARPKPEANLVEYLSKQAPQLGVQTEVYKDFDISILEFDGRFHVVYVRIEDLLVLGFDKEMIYACVDVYRKQKRSLSDDPDFTTTRSKLPKKSSVLAYGNLRSILPRLMNATSLPTMPTADPEAKKTMTETLSKMDGLTTMGLSSTSSGDLTTTDMIVVVDRSQLSNEMKIAYQCKPRENRTLKFIPKDIMSYQWNGCFDAQMMIDSIHQASKRQQKAGGSAAPDFLKNLETRFGQGFTQEVIPAIGQEVGGALFDIDTQGLFPIPKLMVFLQVEDATVINDFINTLGDQESFMWQSEEYNDTTIHFFFLSLGVNLQPSYCLLNDYLLFTTDKEILKKSIDTYRGQGESLRKNKNFQMVNKGLTDQSNAVAYFETDTFLNKIRQLGRWGLKLVQFQFSRIQRMEKQLEDLRENAQFGMGGIRSFEIELQAQKAKVETMRAQGLDVSDEEAKLQELQQNVERVYAMNTSAKEKEKLLAEKIEEDKKKVIDPRLFELYLNRVAYPILNGLMASKAVGLKSTITQEAIETKIFSYWKE